MISASFNGTDQKTLERLRLAASAILSGQVQQMDIEMESLRTYIVTQKLSGQVLKHQSGALIDSTQRIPATASGTTVTGGVTSAGGIAFYGRFFEEGGKGPYIIRPVNKKALAFDGGTGGLNARAAAGMVIVKSVVHPPIPHLPYMKPSLDERKAQIIANLQARAVADGKAAMGNP